MRLVIDLQGAQSKGSRFRGIGRYSKALAHAITRNRGTHEVIIALNGLFPESIEAIRSEFEQQLSHDAIRVWAAPGPVKREDGRNRWRRQAAEGIREGFLASLEPDAVLVTSLFEGITDDAVTSLGLLATDGLDRVLTAVVLYDLIPFAHREIYMPHPASVRTQWYEEKLSYLKRADLLLSISESSRQEAIDLVGFDPTRIVNISSAAESWFRPSDVPLDKETALRTKFGLDRPFIMYTGGIDFRKNIEQLIRAFALLPEILRRNYQLAVVCAVSDRDRFRLIAFAADCRLGPTDFVMTGFVSDDELLSLYQLCHLFVFPSWHEGFGLPVLEAMLCGKAVLAAGTSSIPEVVGRKDALFDPHDVKAIAFKLQEVLTDDHFRRALEMHSLCQAQLFSWDLTAHRALDALESLTKNRRISGDVRRNCLTADRKLRLAYISPLPPERTGIADYSSELLPVLNEYYNIEVVIDQKEVTDPWIQAHCPIRDAKWFRDHAREFDRVLYHMGDAVSHAYMLDIMAEIPGVVVLHDFFLSSLIHYLDKRGIYPGICEQALRVSHGPASVSEYFAAMAMGSYRCINRYPANLPILQNALGVIVHSKCSRDLAKEWYGDSTLNHGAEWACIPYLRVPYTSKVLNRDHARQALGFDTHDFIVCSFGFLSPAKLNHRLFQAWLASPMASDIRCHLIFVGANAYDDYARSLITDIQSSPAASRIHITGWTDTQTYRQYLAATDIAVQLRAISRGETSGEILDCMNAGIPTVINALGSAKEIPEDVVIVLPDQFSDAQLIDALTSLWQMPSRRIFLRDKGRKYVHSNHAPAECALRYMQAIERFYANPVNKALSSVIHFIAALKAPPLPNSQIWRDLARDLDLDFPTPSCSAHFMDNHPERH